MTRNNVRDEQHANPSDDSRAALIRFFEDFEPETEAGRVLKDLRLKALREGQELSSWEDIQRELGREVTSE